ncbi:uncharacterized protein LOC119706174 [Motacilla alba alba]|uniref:uncharacterized protein LOC119706174 n=1 Tax=Motacilla alba alba TaxID=1094192 RepID=UPI0018D56325|nr:uncharacterized protein LOC119706174 [Motacilla alba alba]
MALALRLFLLLLLVVALPARAAQAAPLQARGADEHRKASPAAWLHEDFQPLKLPAGKTFQAPLLVAAHKRGSHRTAAATATAKAWPCLGLALELLAAPGSPFSRDCPARGSFHPSVGPLQARGPPAPAPEWKAELSKCLGGHQSPRCTHCHWGLKENLQQCHRSSSVPPFFADEPDDDGDPDDEDDPVDEVDLDSQPISITEPLGDAESVSAGRTFPGPLVDVARKPSSHRRAPLRRKNKPIGASKSLAESKHPEQKRSDVDSQRGAAATSTGADNIGESRRRVFCWGTPCLIKLMALVAGAALCLMICYAGIWYCWKRKW